MPEKLWEPDQKQLKKIVDQLMEKRMGEDWRTFFDPSNSMYHVSTRVDWESGRFLMSARDLKKLSGAARINKWTDTVTAEFYRDAWGTALMDAARQLIKLPIVDRLYNGNSNGSGTVNNAVLEQYELKGPGLGDVPVEEMQTLYRELDGWIIGLHINRACVLWPPKSFGGWFEPMKEAEVVCRPGTGCQVCILRGTSQCKQYRCGSERTDRNKGEIRLPDDVLWDGPKSGEGSEGMYGVAFDIGTTTIAAMLWNLGTGKRSYVPMASLGIPNPQRIRGVDVISRIEYAQDDPERVEEMQKLVVGAMNDLMEQLVSQVLEDSEEAAKKTVAIRRISAVGNPTMMHFLFGKDAAGLAKAPFIGETLPLEIDAAELGLNVCGMLRTLPVMGGHLGADAAGALLAARLFDQAEPTLVMDIGTNGELLMTDGAKNLWGCSTAAGPAFEGASVSPGSRLIDAAAAMLDQGWMDEDGLVSRPGLLTQKDIRQLQMAKGAISAGAEILRAKRNAGETATRNGAVAAERIWLAGTFGNHTRPESARRIGLIPKEALVESCGNLAGVGASLILLSEREWERGCEWARTVTHVELAEEAEFGEAFVRNMEFW